MKLRGHFEIEINEADLEKAIQQITKLYRIFGKPSQINLKEFVQECGNLDAAFISKTIKTLNPAIEIIGDV